MLLAAKDAPTCVLHKRHQPVNLTVERHHVIPVAWQLFWQPQVAPYPGPDTEGRGTLWDDRTVVLCPTGHRNVHMLIVEAMHAFAAGQTLAVKRGPQAVWAQAAICRFKDVGGDIMALTAAHKWGES